MVFDGIILSFIVGFLRKGNLKGLAQLKLKWGWIFPLLLLVELFIFSFQNNYSFLAHASNYIFIAVYILGLFFIILNRNQPGFLIIFLGVLLNFIVIFANGGRMPVSLTAASVLDPEYIKALTNSLYAKHEALSNSTHLGFLGDIIPITKPYPRTQIISIGDIIMNVGIFLFIQSLMLQNLRKKKEKGLFMSLKGGE